MIDILLPLLLKIFSDFLSQNYNLRMNLYSYSHRLSRIYLNSPNFYPLQTIRRNYGERHVPMRVMTMLISRRASKNRVNTDDALSIYLCQH